MMNLYMESSYELDDFAIKEAVPSLKRMNKEELPVLYKDIRNAISPILFLALAFYFPLSVILKIWLPKYTESITYLGVLLPIIVFSSKVSLLTNNYLKAYRKEKLMFGINVATLGSGLLAILLASRVVVSLDVVLFLVVVFTMIRLIASEIAVNKVIGGTNKRDYLIEIAITIIFVACARYLSLFKCSVVYLGALIAYFVIYKKNIMRMLIVSRKVINK